MSNLERSKLGPHDIKRALSGNALFVDLEDFYIDDLIPLGDVRGYKKGQHLVSEGEDGDSVFFIVSGKANVTLYSEDGQRIVIATLSDGDMFGEMSILDKLPRSASVEATSDITCFLVGKDSFLEYLNKHHRVYSRFLPYLSIKLRQSTKKIGGLALLDVCGRIAQTLLGMVDEGVTEDDGIPRVPRMTHEELAAQIGSSREVVSRALKKLTEEGYIKVEKKTIAIYSR